MTPKKINLSYTAEDGTTHSREYTDISQVWHPAEETPDKEQLIWYRKKDGQFNTRWTGIDGDIEWLFLPIMQVSIAGHTSTTCCPLQAVREFRTTHRKNRIVGNFRAQLLSKI